MNSSEMTETPKKNTTFTENWSLCEEPGIYDRT